MCVIYVPLQKTVYMKLRLIIVLILLIPTFGFSQMNQSIDFVSGIELSYRQLTTRSNDQIVGAILESREQEEVMKLNWRIGFNFNRRLTSNLVLRTGLRLASVGYKGEKRTGLKWPSEHDGNGGWVADPNLPRESQLIYDYWFVEMPIVGRFEMTKKKLSPFIELGILPSYYMITRTTQKTDIGTDSQFENGDVHNFNRVHFVGFLSFGMNYSLNDNLQFFGQPAFRYHFTKLADAPIAEYLFNCGIEFGIRNRIQ